MTISIEEILKWNPDRLSEDHLDNFILNLFKISKNWDLIYYNPPHGSWKFINIYRSDYLYRQVGPKRGIGKLRRPDIAFQKRSLNSEKVLLFLVESKISRNNWSDETPSLMKNYFEGAPGFTNSTGVRQIPFRHKRKRGNPNWEQIDTKDLERTWFIDSEVEYIFGFAYSLGLVKEEDSILEDINWIDKTIKSLSDPIPPIIFMAVGWLHNNFQPFILTGYSKIFPNEIQIQFEDLFKNYKFKRKIRDLSSYLIR